MILASTLNVYVLKLPWSLNLPAHHCDVVCPTSLDPQSFSYIQAAMLLYIELASSIDTNLYNVCHDVFLARCDNQGC